MVLYEFSRELLPPMHTSDKSHTKLSKARAYQSQPTLPGSPGEADDRKSARGMHVPSSSGSGEVELGRFAPRAHGGHMGEPPSKGRADISVEYFHGGGRLPDEFRMCGTASQHVSPTPAAFTHRFFGRGDFLGVPPHVVGIFQSGRILKT